MKKGKNKVVDFFKSPFSIIVYLLILICLLLGFNYYLARCNKVYVFSGYTDEFMFMDGSIYLGNDIHNFTSPSIVYSGEEILLREYEVGYYIEKDREYHKISVVNEKTEESAKLSEIIRSSEFSFTEYHKKAMFFSKEMVENLKGLCFLINGTDEKGNEVSIKIPLEITRVSK